MKKKIIIIDDDPLIPVLIRELIEGEDQEMEITQIAKEKKEFLDMLSKDSFDAALIDISIGGVREGGLDLLRILKSQGSKVPVIILSAHDESIYAFKCLALGAAGYVNKICVCDELIPGLKKILNGELFVSGNEGERILMKHNETSAPRQSF